MCSITLSKVETAFRMFDTDQDGFLSWEEFQQVRKKFTKKKQKLGRIGKEKVGGKVETSQELWNCPIKVWIVENVLIV